MTTTVSIGGVGAVTAPLISNIPYSSLSWSKLMDDFGTAQVQVSSQCVPAMLLGAHPWVHELRIEVDGELAWIGPIRFVTLPLNDNADTFLTIEAYEMSYWFALRFARIAFDFTDTNTAVSEVVRQIATAALTPRDPGMLEFLDISSCPVIHDRAVLPNDNAWVDHLRDVVGSLMHMRSHGRAVSFWCYGECLGTLPRATAEQFGKFDNLVYDGERYATDAAVFGRDAIEEVAEVVADPGPPIIVGKPAEPAIPAVLGLATPGGSPTFPGVLVERTFRDASYLDNASATRFAENAITSRSPLGSAENEALRAEVLCDSPWPITRVAPGMCATVGTRYGDLQMQIESVSGEVSEDGIESFSIGFNEILTSI